MNEQAKHSIVSKILIPIFALLIVLGIGCLSLCYAEEQDFSVIDESNAQQFIDMISNMQSDLDGSWGQYENAQSQYEHACQELERLAQVLEESQKKIESTQARVNERAVEMYKGISTFSLMDVLFGSVDMKTFVNQLNMYSHIAERDNGLIIEAQQAKEEAQLLTEQAKQLQAESLAEMQRVEAIQALIDAYNEKLHEYYAQIPSEYDVSGDYEESYEEPAAEEYQSSGVFCHPCPGCSGISSDYGYRSFDDSFHKGVDFWAGYGTPVYAADSGTVIGAADDDGWNGGCGNNVRISHGGGLMTWYMHLSSVAVSYGEWVEAGQYIGEVGSTGYSTGPHLHFQVELNGSAVNPHNYL